MSPLPFIAASVVLFVLTYLAVGAVQRENFRADHELNYKTSLRYRLAVLFLTAEGVAAFVLIVYIAMTLGR